MLLNKSFHQRVRDVIVDCAKSYKKVFLDYEYLLCSEAFQIHEYYIIDAHKDNYKHLTGVNSTLKADAFFEKCYQGTLLSTDFDFKREPARKSDNKGTVRRKITVLPEIFSLFEKAIEVEEDFEKNHIRCAFAVAKDICTLGFHATGKAKPMTLLKGFELNQDKAKKVDLILRRKKGQEQFDEIMLGDIRMLEKYQPGVEKLLSPELSRLLREKEAALSLVFLLEYDFYCKMVHDSRNQKIFLTFQTHIARIIHIFQ